MTKEADEKARIFGKMQAFSKPMSDFIDCAERINKTVIKVKGMLTNEEFKNVTLYNAAFIGNNKVVELVQLFNKKNKSICGSYIKTACINYFSEILNNASTSITRYYLLINAMNEITTRINRFVPGIRKIVLLKNKEVLLQLISEVEKSLTDYDYYSQVLFKFDLENDVSELYECQKRLFGSDKEDTFIKRCNEELAELGISKRMVKTTNDQVDSRTYQELKNILYKIAIKVQTDYQAYPHISLIFGLHINDDIELLNRAYASKDIEIFRKLKERISSYDVEDLTKNIIQMIGEIGAFYGYGPSEFYQLLCELEKLGLLDEAEKISDDIKTGKYDEYVNLETLIFSKVDGNIPPQKRRGTISANKNPE